MGVGAGGGLATYRAVLRLPGLTPLAAVGFAARLPVTATGVVLTLHVAVGLDRGFAAAGLVGGAVTAGVALGAPLVGRADRPAGPAAGAGRLRPRAGGVLGCRAGA